MGTDAPARDHAETVGVELAVARADVDDTLATAGDESTGPPVSPVHSGEHGVLQEAGKA